MVGFCFFTTVCVCVCGGTLLSAAYASSAFSASKEAERSGKKRKEALEAERSEKKRSAYKAEEASGGYPLP